MKAKKSLQTILPYPLPPGSRRGDLRLDMNENSWGCLPAIHTALKRIRREDISLYPEYGRFYNLLAEKTGFRETEFCLTAGADEAIRAIMETFIDKADEVILPVPTFSIFQIAARLQQAKIRPIPYHQDLSFPTQEIISSINSKTKAVVVVSPNNPTGTILRQADLISILRRLPDGIVILDHTYHRFAGQNFSTLIRRFPNLAVLHSFSKIYGLAGLRLGYILSQPETIQEIRKVMPPFSVNSLALIAAEAALAGEAKIKKTITTIVSEREKLKKKLQTFGLTVHPSNANFLLVDFGSVCETACKKLSERRIRVKDVSNEPLLAGKLRITVGRPEENRRLLAALWEILPPQLLLFDMDGVLVDVSRSYRIAIRKTAESFLGGPVSAAEVEKIKSAAGSNNDWDATDLLLKTRGAKISKKMIIDRFQSFYWGKNGNGYIRKERWLLPRALLKKLQKKYQLGIVTGRPLREAEFALKRFGVYSFFSTLIAMEDTQNRPKPDPLGIQTAMKKAAAPRAVYFGDHPDDMRSASAAGIRGIGVTAGQKKQDKLLRESGAQATISSIENILEVLS